jgi:3-oxocholest-4-en-26-oate---CoA ligase
MGSFNVADAWELAADAVPEREALVVGEQRRSYAQVEERANRLAHLLAGRGVGPGDHVALYLENCAEYVEAMLAAYKLRAVPINVNHRYVAGELRYLLDNSDSVGVLTQPSLRPLADEVAGGNGAAGRDTAGGGSAGGVRFVISTGDELEGLLAGASPDRVDVERSGDDHYVLYTGGTTGLPKGVVWRQEDAFFACFGGGDPMRLEGPVERFEQLAERMVDVPVCYLPVAPMMHAAAQWTSLAWLFAGGKAVLMPGGPLDADAVWRAIGDEAVTTLTVVGDAVARPLLDAWDAAGGYPIPSLWVIGNGGAPMSPATKQRLLDALPGVMLVDGFGSSEAGVQGAVRTTRDEWVSNGARGFDSHTKPVLVLDGDGAEVTAGSGVVGEVLAGGRLPLGYYNDPERTAEVFVEHGGQRWLRTGDLATVEDDGALTLRGRGSGVINTGGEKVFPEEVEGVLRTHPAVYDCVVVGMPDERWGSAVTAVVQPVDGAAVDVAELAVHCKQHLAGYKAPKRVVVVDRVVRSPSGKADYRWARDAASA